MSEPKCQHYCSSFSKEKAAIDTLNIKSHDLKHQLNQYRSTLNQDAYNELDNLITSYDSYFNTWNKAVDIILTEIEILCHQKNIPFTSLIDGKLFEGMKENNIYALLGISLKTPSKPVKN